MDSIFEEKDSLIELDIIGQFQRCTRAAKVW